MDRREDSFDLTSFPTMVAPHSFTLQSPSTPADHLYQEMLLAAAQQVVAMPQSPPSSVPRRLPRSTDRSSRVLTCTHTTMNRVYGQLKCHMCGKFPSLGWVYACQQDQAAQPLRLTEDSMGVGEALVAVEDGDGYFEAQAKIAESLNMSGSVVGQMRRGEYTFDQVEILLGQRRHVLELIRGGNISTRSGTPVSNYNTSTTRRPDTTTSDETIIATVGTTAASESPAPAVQPIPTTNSTSARNNKQPIKKPLCTFQVCHTCRPFFHDRLPMSFEHVVQNQMPAMSPAEMNELPLHSAEVVKGLGLRERIAPAPEQCRWPTDGGGGGHEFPTDKTGWDDGDANESESSSTSNGSGVFDDQEDADGGVKVSDTEVDAEKPL